MQVSRTSPNNKMDAGNQESPIVEREIPLSKTILYFTLPKTNSSPLKIGLPKRKVVS